MVSVKGIVTKIDFEGSKKIIGKRSLSLAELCALLIMLVCLFMYHKALYTDPKFILPFLLLVFAMILW